MPDVEVMAEFALPKFKDLKPIARENILSHLAACWGAMQTSKQVIEKLQECAFVASQGLLFSRCRPLGACRRCIQPNYLFVNLFIKTPLFMPRFLPLFVLKYDFAIREVDIVTSKVMSLSLILQ